MGRYHLLYNYLVNSAVMTIHEDMFVMILNSRKKNLQNHHPICLVSHWKEMLLYNFLTKLPPLEEVLLAEKH